MKMQHLGRSRAVRTTVAASALFSLVAIPVVGQGDIHERAKVTEIWEPVPPMVNPGTAGSPPSDAIVLFDGSDLEEWESVAGGPAEWKLDNDAMTVDAKGDIQTKRELGNVQLHIEWRTPFEVVGESQERGNSGIFLAGRYEVQVLDSYDNATYSNGQAGSVYKQHIPLVNASRGPGEWQSFDIVFMAPLFNDGGRVIRPATVTVFHNGVLVQNNVTIQGPTTYVGKPRYEAHGKAPLRLQDHRNPVSYRNIWIREL